jgi:malonyl-CoA O-methyltransferase
LIVSSLSVQWCADTEGLFNEIYRVLKPGGTICFSTLVDGTLAELKKSWALADDAQHVNQFETEHNYRCAIAALPFAKVDLKRVSHTLLYDSVRGLLSELKAIGAHNVTPDRSRSVTPKSAYQRFERAYQHHRCEDGMLPATYQILLGCLVK